MDKPRWSIAIPAYNAEKWIAETITSVRQHPPEKYELLLIDDCSTDQTIAAGLSAAGGQLRIVRHERNLGAIPTFNRCVAESKGELIHILHADDLVGAEFYRSVQSAADLHLDTGIFISRCFDIDESGSILSLSARLGWMEQPSRDPGELLYANLIRTPSVTVRRSAYERTQPYREDLIHTADWEMFVRLIITQGGCFINQPLAKYRDFSGSHTGKIMRTAENLRDIRRAIGHLATLAPRVDRRRLHRDLADRALAQARNFERLNDVSAAEANRRFWREHASLAQRLRGALGDLARSIRT